MRAKFKNSRDITTLSASLMQVACALGNDASTDIALDGLAGSLEELMFGLLKPGNVTMPQPVGDEAWADDPAIVDAIGPLPVPMPGRARPNPAYPAFTAWALPRGLLRHLDLQLHTQPGSAAAHVGVAKRLGPIQTQGQKRNRLLDGVAAKIMASPGTPDEVAAAVNARAAAAEVQIIGPRIIMMFLCAHR